jgi:hypothetical protein
MAKLLIVILIFLVTSLATGMGHELAKKVLFSPATIDYRGA